MYIFMIYYTLKALNMEMIKRTMEFPNDGTII